MKILYRRIDIVLLWMMLCQMLAAQDTQIGKQQYLDYCISTANHLNGELVSFRTKWLEQHKPDRSKGYAPPDREIYLAALNANLFRITGDDKYLIPVKDILLHYGEYKRHYPPDFHLARIEYGSSLPALPQAFSMRRYVSAYITLKGAAPLGEKEAEIIENNIAESADYLMRIQEWGPMNRAIICAEGLGLAAMALPQHAYAAEWKKMAGIIAEDNFRISHMEDSQKYLLIWMYSMIHYAVDVHGDEMLLSQPLFSKWFGYLLDIFSPAGLIPDYGDADWGSSRFLCLPIFEEGAKLLKKGELRWAAARVFNKWIPGNPDNVHIAMLASDACLWADFELGGSKPRGMAGTAPDRIAKKIVFRSGWEDKSTYLLLNYRDEDDDAGVFLHYLRSTLAVNEEKLHHGHADENSMCLLMKNGSVLLHDGGYRDGIPSGKYGAYRADYFHNRAVARRIPAKKAEGVNLGKGLLANIHNNGAYIKSQTEKTDHLIKGAFEMSRTRSMYPGNGYIYDRVLVYLKEPDCFVITDVIKFIRKGKYISGTLWHTGKIFSAGANWYDTGYDSLGNASAGDGKTRLLIWFPKDSAITGGTEKERRYYSEEQLIYRARAMQVDSGDAHVYISVLFPHNAAAPPEELAFKIRILRSALQSGIAAIEVSGGDKTYLAACRLDADAPLSNSGNRPKYNWESGRYKVGEVETDADFLYVASGKEAMRYAFAGGTRLTYKGVDLFSQSPSSVLYRYDGKGAQVGVSKVRYWEGVY